MEIMRFVDVKIDAKRRSSIPAHLLAAAGMHPGDHVIARVVGPGRLVIETPDASRAAIRDRVRSNVEPVTAKAYDATTDIRDARNEDNRISDDNAARRSASGNAEDSEDRGRALLAHLGM